MSHSDIPPVTDPEPFYEHETHIMDHETYNTARGIVVGVGLGVSIWIGLFLLTLLVDHL